MATPSMRIVRQDRRSDSPRRWRDHSRKQPQALEIVELDLELEVKAEPSSRSKIRTQSDRERVLAGDVLARLTAFVCAADEYGLLMIDAALRIHRLGFAR
jgi:hypothetical protein